MAEALGTEPVMTAAEYAESVNQWLQQAYQWNVLAMGFPSYLAYQASLQSQTNQASQSSFGSRPHDRPATPPRLPEEMLMYSIPPIWKRVMAEVIDFIFWMAMKLFLTFMFIDLFNVVDYDEFFDKYEGPLQALLAGEQLDRSVAFEMTYEIVFLELINKFVVCLFETLCTFRGPFGTIGGATPGKLMMGLKVIRCDQVTLTGNPDQVRVMPATNLGLFWAMLRSLLKNLSMAFLLPVSITFLFFPFNRTIYDVFSKSIVVESIPPNQRDQRR